MSNLEPDALDASNQKPSRREGLPQFGMHGRARLEPVPDCIFGSTQVGGISIMTKHLVNFALTVMTFAAAPLALKSADAEALCPLGNATLRGTYMLRGEGTIVGVGPATAVGWLTYDGKGNVVNSFMSASVNGVISMFTISGPYTVNSDCARSTDLSGGHYNFVVSPDGNRVNWIQTDPATVFSGTEVRLGKSGLME